MAGIHIDCELVERDGVAGSGRRTNIHANRGRASRPGIIILLAVFASLAPAAAGPSDPGAQLVRLPERRALAFRCTGNGSPTVILEGGWGATSLGWNRVQRLVAQTNRVCSYDRAGMGLSDPGPLPRDGAAIARDLDMGLRAAKIAGPYVVVGHSAGGLYVRLFADRRPGDVVGMVLVDPSVEYQDRRLSAVFGPGSGSTAALRDRSAACLAAAAAHELPSLAPRLAKATLPLRRRPGRPKWQNSTVFGVQHRTKLRPVARPMGPFR